MSHIKGGDERTLARLVKRYGATNVVAEAHEQAGKRVKHNPCTSWVVAETAPDGREIVLEMGLTQAAAVRMVRELKRQFPRVYIYARKASSLYRGENPRRRVTKRARRFIGRTIRRLAHRGERAPQRIAIAYAKARRRGFRVPKANPMSRKDFEYMAALIANLQLNGVPQNCLNIVTDFAVEVGKKANPRFDADRFARRIIQLVGGKHPFRYVRNPTLALVGANPRGHRLGKCVEVRYVRETGAHRGRYYHRFKARANLLAMPDGSLAIR